MTATRLQSCATTPRSCVISSTPPGVLVDQRAEEAQDLRLHGDVQSRGRLVGDEQRRAERERDGDRDALVHPAAQLVRVRLEARLGGRDADLAQEPDRRRARLPAPGVPVGLEDLDDLVADREGGVEGRHRVLENGRDLSAEQGTLLLRGHRHEVAALEEDPPVDAGVLRQEAEDARPSVVLPDPDSPTRPSTSPRSRLSETLADDGQPAVARRDAVDLQERSQRSRALPRGSSQSCNPSPIRLKARTRTMIARPGAATIQAELAMKSRPSESIRPSDGLGGLTPRPM